MKSKFTFFAFCMILFFSCKKDKNIEAVSDCYSSYLQIHNLIPHTDQDIGCKSYVKLFGYENELYFQSEVPCLSIDIAWPITDCEGNDICAEESEIDCDHFYANSTSRGILVTRE